MLLSSAKGGRRAASASPTPASVPGVNLPRPASILLLTSLNTLMESAGTGMTGNAETFLDTEKKMASFLVAKNFHLLPFFYFCFSAFIQFHNVNSVQH